MKNTKIYNLKSLTRKKHTAKQKSITRSTSFITRTITPREWFKYDMDACSTLLGALIDTYDINDIERYCPNILLFEADYPKVFKTHEYITSEITNTEYNQQNLNSTLSIVLKQINKNNTNNINELQTRSLIDIDEMYDETSYLLDETRLENETQDENR